MGIYFYIKIYIPHNNGAYLFWFYKPLISIAFTLFPTYQIIYENLSGNQENLFLQNISPSAYFLSYHIVQLPEALLFPIFSEFRDSCSTGIGSLACFLKWI